MRTLRKVIPAEHQDLELWPRIEQVSLLSDAIRNRYLNLKLAIEKFASGESIAQIRVDTGIEESELRRQIRRCLTLSPAGSIYGFCALVRGARIERYTRSASSDKAGWTGTGFAGSMDQLFDKYPEVHDLVISSYCKLKSGREKPQSARIEVRRIHGEFLDALRELGFTDERWPFNTKDTGYRSLCRFCERLSDEASDAAVKARAGEDAFRRRGVGSGIPSVLPALRPLLCKQMDYHLVDAASVFTVKNKYGDSLRLPIARWYIGFIAEEKPVSITGAYVTLEVNPSADSALELVSSSLDSSPYKSDDPRALLLRDGKCLTVQLLPQLANTGFGVLKVDRAWANSANDVVNNLIDVIGCAINFGPVKAWWRRSIIERINGEFTRKGLQQLPTTYGNSPQDTKKNSPEETAIKYDYDLNEILAIIHGAILDFNLARNEGEEGSAPVRALELLLADPSTGVFLQQLPAESIDSFLIHMHAEDCTVRGSLTKNIPPFFKLKKWRYTSPSLAQAWRLLGQEITTYTDRKLARRVYAVVKATGEQLGWMEPIGKYRTSNLSWRERNLLQNGTAFEKAHENTRSSLQRSLADRAKQKNPTSREVLNQAKQAQNARQKTQEANFDKAKTVQAPREKRSYDPFGFDEVPTFGVWRVKK